MDWMRLERTQTIGEEIVNAILHGIGALLSLVGFVPLLIFAFKQDRLVHALSLIVYGISLLFLYLMSTLYHSIHHAKAKNVFERMDHAGVSYLIAGTFTPISFFLFADNLFYAWVVVLVIWAVAIAFSVVTITVLKKVGIINLMVYAGMGLSAAVLIPNISQTYGVTIVAWLMAGGACYLVGMVFFGFTKFTFSHALWHVFVFAGSVVHYWAIYAIVGAGT